MAPCLSRSCVVTSISGKQPSGYVRGRDEAGRATLTPDPATAPVVVEVVERVAAGEALTAIARDLNARSIPTMRGAPAWASAHVRSVASSPTSAGLRRHHDQVVEGTWPAIVDRGTWQRAQAILADARVVVDAAGRTRHVPRTHRRLRRWLLTGGLSRCGVCGSPLVAGSRGTRSGRREPIYSCHPNAGGKGCVAMGAEAFEAEVIGQVFALLAAGRLPVPVGGGERDRAHAQLADARHRLRSLAADYAAGVLDELTWQEVRETASQQLRFAERAVAALGVEDVDLVDLEGRWEGLTVGQRRRAVEAVVESVTLSPATPGARRHDPGRISIDWRA